jgi:nucleoside-diphosphate-sugar epimerase
VIVLGPEATWRSTWGYVDNVADAVARAVEHDVSRGRVYNVADTPARSLEEWVQQIAVLTGWQGRVVHAIHPASDSHNWQQDLVTDTTRIRIELGFAEPVSVEVALARTIAWERQNPPKIDPAQFDYAAEDRTIAAEGI